MHAFGIYLRSDGHSAICGLKFHYLGRISWAMENALLEGLDDILLSMVISVLGFILCDITMFIAHIILFGFTVALIIAISWPEKFRIYSLKPAVFNYFLVLLLHTIVELGVSTYIYSWYGLAAWRAPYLIVNIMFYIIRFVLHVWFLVISYSYILELRQELYAPVDPEMSQEIEALSIPPSAVSGVRYSGRHYATSSMAGSRIR
uniref:Uncharacterized protein n=1 Tax=Schistocephalus solidus TaxID=70667 RepID=A0A0X3NLD7_SCHSO